MALSWLLSVPHRIFSRSSRTALVLVMPHKLIQKYNLPKALPEGVSGREDYKHYIDQFVSKAKAAGARVAYVDYSHMLWRQMLPVSDDIFIFETDVGYMKFRKSIRERPLTVGEEGILNNKKRLAISAHGNPEEGFGTTDGGYGRIADALVPILREHKVSRILVCGGEGEIARFLRALGKKHLGIAFFVSENFLVCGKGGTRLDGLAADRIKVEMVPGWAEPLLRLF